jgi:hypothetical protein
MQFNEKQSIMITLKLAPHEYAALNKLANKTGRTLEETATGSLLRDLVKHGLITESAERDGWQVLRLED